VVDATWNISAEAASLHRRAIVWDNVWPLEPDCGNDLEKLALFAAAGVTVLSLTIAGDNHNISEAVQRVAAVRRDVLGDPEHLVLVEHVADVFRAKESGRLGVTFHFEGTRCFERNLDLVETYYRLGVKHALLAFNTSNSVGGGCAESADSGLTRLGARLVAEFERVGMLVDLSHTGYRTTMDVMERASRPVIFSHSNAAGLHQHFRNLADEQVRACAATGGLIGVSASSQYLGEPRASTSAIMRHVDYYVQMVGARHVALGLDLVFDAAMVDAYMRARPEEWPMTLDPNWKGSHYGIPEQIPELTQAMLMRGYGEDAILDILGRNYLRIFGDLWR
jgi:membrane dipeptidase